MFSKQKTDIDNFLPDAGHMNEKFERRVASVNLSFGVAVVITLGNENWQSKPSTFKAKYRELK